MDFDFFPVDRDILSSKMLQRGYYRNAACINKTAIEIEDVDVGTNRPAFRASYDAERFGIDCIGPTNCLL